MFQFTTRHLLLGTACVAAILGGLFWLDQLVGIDSSSEQFLVDGKPIVAPWTEMKWEPGRSGLWAPGEYFTIELPSATDKPIKIDQSLVRFFYKDHFGNDAFEVDVGVLVGCSPGETTAHVQPMASGGGNTDGACTIEFAFDAEEEMLSVRIRQWIHRERIAKQCELRFHWDGERFCPVDGADGRPDPRSAQ